MENPHDSIQHVRDSQNLFVRVYGPFCFAELTVNGMPQLQQHMDKDFIFQQNRAPPPPYFLRGVTSYINRTVVVWIGCRGSIAWTPLSLYLRSLKFSV
jgi:hypothetical protein